MSKQFLILCLVIFSVSCFKQANTTNDRPIIGIYTAPSTYSKYPGLNYSMIAASYVKFVEFGGAQAVPIPYDATIEYLDSLFSKINGILFPGGSVEFTYTDTVDAIFLRNAAYLVQKAKNATDAGDFFPIWGTCQGFELIHYIVSGFDSKVLKSGYNDTDSHTTKKIDISSKLFEHMPLELLKHIESFPAVYYHHNKGVQAQAYANNELLSSTLKYTSMGYSDKNVPFIATFEALNYPIYGSQFHPEKNMFEWKIEAARDYKSTLATQYFANFFVNQTRKNMHSFTSTSEENQYLIYKYPVYSLSTSTYTQVYVLHNFGNPEVNYHDAYVPATKKLIKNALENQNKFYEDDDDS